jgi:antitoxin component of MazEF toxin-antitoxin module
VKKNEKKSAIFQSATRKVRKIGGSLYLCLPKTFCVQNQVDESSYFTMVAGNGGDVKIIPTKGE